jgi:hypothetical protein
MVKFLNAYSGDVHVSGTVGLNEYGKVYVGKDVEVHSGEATYDEAVDMLFDQLDAELERLQDDML